MIDYDSRSWIRVIFRVNGSVAPGLVGRIALAGGLGAAANYLYEHYKFHTPTVAHTMIGLALGLLLVFRTNASFDRWWEGRKLLGGMVNRTRDLARQLVAYTPDDSRVVVDDSTRLLNAYFAVAMQGLRNETDLTAVGDVLTEEEREKLGPLKSRATVVLLWIAERLGGLARAGKISDVQLLAMDSNLTALVDYIGGCERIVRTPIPFAYAQHIKLFVTLWCFTVPFAIVDAMHGATWFASAVLSFALFGIDEIGVEIEDPFGYDSNDLPIDRVAQTVKTSMADIAAR